MGGRATAARTSTAACSRGSAQGGSPRCSGACRLTAGFWYLLAPDAAPSSRISPTNGQLQRGRPSPVMGDGDAAGERRRRDARLPGPDYGPPPRKAAAARVRAPFCQLRRYRHHWHDQDELCMGFPGSEHHSTAQRCAAPRTRARWSCCAPPFAAPTRPTGDGLRFSR